MNTNYFFSIIAGFSKLSTISLFMFISIFPALSQYENIDVVKVPEAKVKLYKRTINIPDAGNYKVLKCDFHTHTIFSDGQVTPEFRVSEGARRGLDVIAITDHLELRRPYINADHNESYKRAKKSEQQENILVVPGAEITRQKPFGHFNALFVTDANELDVKDPLKAIDNAVKQGAFIMWNHPGWPNDSSTLYEVQRELIRQNKVHGIEIVNEYEFYPVGATYCEEFNLAYLSNTDIHGVYSEMYTTDRLESPVTLVFAAERTLEGVKEALFAGRTIALFGDIMMGSEKNLRSLTEACLKFKTEPAKGNTLAVEVSNVSDLNFTLRMQNKIFKVRGGGKVRFSMLPHEKIIFPATFINDHSHLELNITDLK